VKVAELKREGLLKVYINQLVGVDICKQRISAFFLGRNGNALRTFLGLAVAYSDNRTAKTCFKAKPKIEKRNHVQFLIPPQISSGFPQPK
jgi:sugar (pentulose or hexulose) kinase